MSFPIPGNERIRQLEDELEKTVKDLESAGRTSENLENEIVKQNQQMEELLQFIRKQNQGKEKLFYTKEEYDAIKQENDALRQELSNKCKIIGELEQKLEISNSRKEKLEAEVERLNTEVKCLKESMNTAEAAREQRAMCEIRDKILTHCNQRGECRRHLKKIFERQSSAANTKTDAEIQKHWKRVALMIESNDECARDFLKFFLRNAQFTRQSETLLKELETRISTSSFNSLIRVLYSVEDVHLECQQIFEDLLIEDPKEAATKFLKEYPGYYSPFSLKTEAVLVYLNKYLLDNFPGFQQDLKMNANLLTFVAETVNSGKYSNWEIGQMLVNKYPQHRPRRGFWWPVQCLFL